MRLRDCARSLALLGLVVALAAASSAAAGGEPRLQVRTLVPFSVRGVHFRPTERVTVTLNGSFAKRVRADASGMFAATFSSVAVSRCDGYRVTAIGSKGSSAKLRAARLMCASVNRG
jgi:hypothetical protein